eukprot:TRINITY_DN8520_c0_g1_i1.p2 TRINITY_DN8520_c0_g1~~TRINITY_DN8520_c0_g1_i1.p2  ORF type:complete len:273 (+),score=61.70 TRINITY_DN8520_c0_g1_i1:55-873(+)
MARSNGYCRRRPACSLVVAVPLFSLRCVVAAGSSLRSLRSRYVFLDFQEIPEAEAALVKAKAAEVACDVCSNITEGILSTLDTSRWQDSETLLAALKAPAEKLRTREEKDQRMTLLSEPAKIVKAERHVLKKKSGCNRLFRDWLLDEGYAVVDCDEIPDQRGGDASWCLLRQMNNADGTPFVYPPRERLTFDTGREALYQACEWTIGTWAREMSMEIPRSLMGANALTNIGLTLQGVCREAGGCHKVQAEGKGKGRAGKGRGTTELQKTQEL